MLGIIVCFVVSLLKRGSSNLVKHIENARKFGVNVVVATIGLRVAKERGTLLKLWKRPVRKLMSTILNFCMM